MYITIILYVFMLPDLLPDNYDIIDLMRHY